jgi:hypothetical protein
MGARIELPFHGDGEHLAADDREQITGREQAESPETESGVGIMRSAPWFDGLRNCRALTLGRFIRPWVDW